MCRHTLPPSTGRHHALVVGPCIWVLISFIQQGWQSFAHASSNVVVDFEVVQFEDPKSALDIGGDVLLADEENPWEWTSSVES